jgi:hypothetical protein
MEPVLAFISGVIAGVVSVICIACCFVGGDQQ